MARSIMLFNVWIVGGFDGSGGLSKAYDFFVQKIGRWPWKPLISKNLILPKHKFALWMFTRGKFLTRDRLPFVLDKVCVLCRGHDESVGRLFFNCDVTIRIWAEVRSWLGMKKCMGSPNAVLKAFRTVYRGTSVLNKMRSAALAATVYLIWNAPNMILFQNVQPNVEDIIKKIRILCLRSMPISFDVVDVL